VEKSQLRRDSVKNTSVWWKGGSGDEAWWTLPKLPSWATCWSLHFTWMDPKPYVSLTYSEADQRLWTANKTCTDLCTLTCEGHCQLDSWSIAPLLLQLTRCVPQKVEGACPQEVKGCVYRKWKRCAHRKWKGCIHRKWEGIPSSGQPSGEQTWRRQDRCPVGPWPISGTSGAFLCHSLHFFNLEEESRDSYLSGFLENLKVMTSTKHISEEC
jgi:hypothetical protein